MQTARQPNQDSAAPVLKDNTKALVNPQSKKSIKRPLSEQDKSASVEDEPLTKRQQISRSTDKVVKFKGEKNSPKDTDGASAVPNRKKRKPSEEDEDAAFSTPEKKTRMTTGDNSINMGDWAATMDARKAQRDKHQSKERHSS